MSARAVFHRPEAEPRRRQLRLLVLLATLLAAVCGCDVKLGGSATVGSASVGLPPGAVPVPSSAATPSAPAVQPPAMPAQGASLPLSFAPLVKRAKPSVVTVRAWVRRRNAFGRDIVEAEGVGTGFVYDAKGYLLTNHHVIENAAKIVVSFADHSETEAKVVGTDPPTDVAVLQIDKQGLQAMPLGDSNALKVGDWVVAIGNPFGLEHTVSAGILSAKGRSRDDVKGLDPTGYFNFLQTDASINPGNSGGPLLNLSGQVVGINAAVRANANNIGFAIPIDMVVQLLPMLLRDGKVQRSAIGIWVEDVSGDEAKRLKLDRRRGARVAKVIPGQAAERAGLAVGDVILAFDSKPIADPNELRWLASIAGVNKAVPVRVARGERVFDIQVTLDEKSGD
jgi:serine protease Do